MKFDLRKPLRIRRYADYVQIMQKQPKLDRVVRDRIWLRLAVTKTMKKEQIIGKFIIQAPHAVYNKRELKILDIIQKFGNQWCIRCGSHINIEMIINGIKSIQELKQIKKFGTICCLCYGTLLERDRHVSR